MRIARLIRPNELDAMRKLARMNEEEQVHRKRAIEKKQARRLTSMRYKVPGLYREGVLIRRF